MRGLAHALNGWPQNVVRYLPFYLEISMMEMNLPVPEGMADVLEIALARIGANLTPRAAETDVQATGAMQLADRERLLLNTDGPDSAISVFKRAVEVNGAITSPQSGLREAIIAEACLALGYDRRVVRFKEEQSVWDSRKRLERKLEHSSDDRWIFGMVELGAALLGADRPDEAGRWFRKALSLWDGGADMAGMHGQPGIPGGHRLAWRSSRAFLYYPALCGLCASLAATGELLALSSLVRDNRNSFNCPASVIQLEKICRTDAGLAHALAHLQKTLNIIGNF
jgi:hypothetical protein